MMTKSLRRLGAVGVATLVVAGVLLAGSATAQTSPTTVSAQPDELTVSVAPTEPPGPLPVEASNRPNSGSARPIVVNTGPTPVTVQIRVTLDRDQGNCTSNSAAVAPASLLIPAGAALQADLRVFLPDNCAGQTGAIILAAPGSAPTIVALTVSQQLSQINLWIPVGVAVTGFLLLVFLTAGAIRKDVQIAAAWSFKEAWVTNTSTLGGVLLSVIAATGFLEDILPGTETGYLIGLNLLFGAAILAAPIVYATGSRWTALAATVGAPPAPASIGTGAGAVVGAATTVGGVFGQLATLWVVTLKAQIDSAPKVLIYTLLAAAGVLVLANAFRFVRGVTRPTD